jgi:transcriptional regulator with XRE-family HTH domain
VETSGPQALRGLTGYRDHCVRLSSGQVIRGLREKMGWTQSELALKTGLKQNTISALENDRIAIGVERSKTLARVFGVHPGLLAFPGWSHKSASVVVLPVKARFLKKFPCKIRRM